MLYFTFSDMDFTMRKKKKVYTCTMMYSRIHMIQCDSPLYQASLVTHLSLSLSLSLSPLSPR